MPLLKGGKIVQDGWIMLDGDALPDRGQILVPWPRWQQERAGLIKNNQLTLGVAFPNSEDPALLGDDLARLALIALEFPVFRDGRAYSQARILREQMSFRGELRATGDILQDQAFFMLRCGFDALLLPDNEDEAVWQKALSDFSLWYQPTRNGKTIWQMRHADK